MSVPEKAEPAVAKAGETPSFDRLPPTRVVPESEVPSATSELRKVEIEGYQVGAELGRGGMSVVFQAEHIALHRTVAIKMLLPGLEVPEVIVGRFRSEAEALAKLSHPNIIQIFEVGRVGEIPYLVLEYCAGGNLHQRLGGRPCASKDAAELVEQLARGIDAAHRAGLVHRDLKPANILFHLDGTPKITDFGLAKNLDSDPKRTRPDAILGTPAYMAPEQAARRHADVGPAADIYALGTVLYEMLTGRPPFQAPTELDTLLQVVHDEPVRPRLLQGRIPRDLETICLKCLEKDPRRRYATASDLADDLRRYLQGHTIVARPVGPMARLGKVMRRHPLESSLVAALATVILASSISVIFSLVRKEEALQREIIARQDEAEKHRQVLRGLSDSTLVLADSVWRGNEDKKERLAAKYLEQIPEEHRAWEWNVYRRLYQGGLFSFPGPSKYVNCLALSGDGKYLAAGTGDSGQNLYVWEAASGKLLHNLPGHAAVFSALAYHPTLPLLASGGPDQVIKLWDPASGKLVRTLKGHRGAVLGIVFHPDGKRLISAATDRTIRFWEVATGKELAEPIQLESTVRALAATPDGDTLVGGGDDAATVAGKDHLVYVWDLLNRAPRELKGHLFPVASVACSPNGAWIASCDKDGFVRLWERSTGEPRFIAQAHSRQAMSVAFSPDSTRLASTGADNLVVIRKIPAGTEELQQLQLAGHRGGVSCGVFSGDGRRIFTGSVDETVKVWDAHNQPPAIRYDAAPKPTTALSFSPDEKLLAHAGEGPNVRLISMSGERKVTILPLDVAGIRELAFSTNGQSLACLAKDGAVYVLDPKGVAAGPLSSISTTQPIEAMTWSEAGNELLFVAGKDNPRIGRKGAGGEPLEHAIPLSGPAGVMAFSEGGEFLATESSGSVQVWKAFPPQRLFTVKPGNDKGGRVRLLALNASGTRLAVGFAGVVELWSQAKREVRFENKADPQVLTFVSNGQRLLSKWGDRALRSWDADNGQFLPLLETPPGQVVAVAVGRTGRHVAFATSSGQILCWDSFDADDEDYRRFLMSGER